MFRLKPKTIDIPLSVLCVLWVDEQSQDDDGIDPEAESFVTTANSVIKPMFTYNGIAEFYNAYIAPYSAPKEALEIIIKLLKVLNEKGKCPSVVDDDSEALKPLVSVSLVEHSLDVARNAFAINNKGRRVIRNNTTDVLIAALAHDMGKLPDLVNLNGGISNHVFTCLTFIKPLLADFTTGPAIMEAIKFLHAKPKERQGKIKDMTLLNILKEANAQARKAELETIQNTLLQDKPENKESASIQDISEENTEQITAKQAEKQITKNFIVETLKPVLARSIEESLIYHEKVFVNPVFLQQIVSEAAGKQDVSIDKLTETLGCQEVQAFKVRRFAPKKEPQPKLVTLNYITLDREVFGLLSKEIFDRQKKLMIKKVF